MDYVSSNSVNDLDKWIEKLNDCKPLTEAEVKHLCEQVSYVLKVWFVSFTDF